MSKHACDVNGGAETILGAFLWTCTISSPEPAILLDCARNRDLWARLKARQKNGQISLGVHFNHNLRRTRRIKPEPGFPGSGFGFDQSPCASRPLVKGTRALGTRLEPLGHDSHMRSRNQNIEKRQAADFSELSAIVIAIECSIFWPVAECFRFGGGASRELVRSRVEFPRQLRTQKGDLHGTTSRMRQAN